MKKQLLTLLIAVTGSITFAQNIPYYLPKNGLVGWYPFNGNADDESGNGNHGKINGATLTTDRTGALNSAFYFDGVNDYIQSKSNNFSFENKPRSMSIWFKINENFSKTIVFMNYGKCTPNNSSGIGIEFPNSVPNPNFFSWTRQYDLIAEKKFTLNTYHNITATFDGTNSRLYFDGRLIGEKNQTKATLLGDLFIGSSAPNQQLFKGELDDLSIYNRALTDEEIKQLYEGCTKETATSTSFNTPIYTSTLPVKLSASPIGGTFSGNAVSNNVFEPSKAKLGQNLIQYNFKNSTGCQDVTNFNVIVSDTIGNICKETIYDTVLKLTFKLTTGLQKGTNSNLKIYPNPTSDRLIIEANDIIGLKGYTYRILDLQGKEVYKSLVTMLKTEISLSTLGAKGIYVLHIIDENGTSIENNKIVLE
jgi:hypothetical protein